MILDALYFLDFKPFQVFTMAEVAPQLKALGMAAKAIRIALKSPLFRASGRRAANYTLPTPTTVLKAAGGDESKRASDPLNEAAFSSLHAYRAALHHALIVRRPDHYTRHLLAKRIGVCKNTTRNYDRAAGHIVTEAYRYQPLTPDMIDDLDRELPNGRKYFLLVKHPSKPFFAPRKKEIALFWLAKGVAVQLVEQVGSRYEAAPGAYIKSWL